MKAALQPLARLRPNLQRARLPLFDLGWRKLDSNYHPKR
jgi:hypothetical protein